MSPLKMNESILKGASLLRDLSNGINTVTELSQRLQFSKSTTHRFLKSLELADLVSQDPITRRYFLGPLFFQLAAQTLDPHQNLVLCSLEPMKRLRDLTDETVALYVRVGVERICLEEMVSPQNIRFTAGKGSVFPLCSGSSGKILLSQLEAPQLALLLKNVKLTALGPNTITDKKLLMEELNQVREQGYATSFGERVAGGASISLAIRNHFCPAALAVMGPESRLTTEVMMKHLKEISAGVDRISRQLASGLSMPGRQS